MKITSIEMMKRDIVVIEKTNVPTRTFRFEKIVNQDWLITVFFLWNCGVTYGYYRIGAVDESQLMIPPTNQRFRSELFFVGRGYNGPIKVQDLDAPSNVKNIGDKDDYKPTYFIHTMDNKLVVLSHNEYCVGLEDVNNVKGNSQFLTAVQNEKKLQIVKITSNNCLPLTLEESCLNVNIASQKNIYYVTRKTEDYYYLTANKADCIEAYINETSSGKLFSVKYSDIKPLIVDAIIEGKRIRDKDTYESTMFNYNADNKLLISLDTDYCVGLEEYNDLLNATGFYNSINEKKALQITHSLPQVFLKTREAPAIPETSSNPCVNFKFDGSCLQVEQYANTYYVGRKAEDYYYLTQNRLDCINVLLSMSSFVPYTESPIAIKTISVTISATTENLKPTTAINTPSTTGLTKSVSTTIINLQMLELEYCQVNTKICAFKLTMNLLEYPSCSIIGFSGVELLTIDCTEATLDCDMYTDSTLHVDLSLFYKENFAEPYYVSLNCLDYKSINHSIERVHVDFVGLHMNNYKDPSTEISNGLTRVNFGTLDDLEFAHTIIIAEDVTGRQGNPFVLNMTCYHQKSYCEFINPNFLSPHSLQKLCILLDFNKTYLDLCKYLVHPVSLVRSAKKRYTTTGGNVFDSLFPVTFELVFTLSETIIDYVITWTENQNSFNVLHGSPVHQVMKPGLLFFNVTLEATNTFTAVISNSNILLKPGINASIIARTTQTLNKTSTFNIKVTEYGNEPCFLIDFNDTSTIHGIKLESMTENHVAFCESETHKRVTWQSILFYRTNQTNSTHLTISHVYTEERLYYVKFMIFNSYNHRQTLNLPVFVSTLNCNAPVLRLIGASSNELLPTKYYASANFFVESIIQVNCKDMSIYHPSWKIFFGPAYEKLFTANKIKLTGTTELRIAANILPYGMAQICLHVVMINNKNIFTEVCGFVQITPSSLVAFIDGGNEVTRSMHMDYHLDASASMDPDIKSLNGVKMFYLCRGVDDEAFNLTYRNLISTRFVYPNSLAVKNGGCYNNGIGRLEPSDATGIKVVIKSDSVPANKKLEITLFMWKRDSGYTNPRVSTFKQIVTFISDPVPVLSIKCLDNCGRYINYNDNHIIEVLCSANCPSKTQYKWFLYECIDENASDCLVVDNDHLTKIVNTNRSTRYYGANKASYEILKWYKLTVKGGNHDSHGEASIIFFVNSPPFGGKCETNIDTGVVLKELFILSCTGWIGKFMPLKYTFYTVNRSVKKVFYNGFLPEYTLTLPQGDEDNNYQLDLFFSITDQLEVSTLVNKSVRVYPPSDIFTAIKNITATMRANDSQLKSYAESGDLDGAANTLMVYSTILNSASKSLTNLTGKSFLENTIELLELRSSFVKTMESFVNETIKFPRANILNRVIKITGALSGVTEYSSELNDVSQNMVMDTIRSFTGLLESSTDSIDRVISATAGVASLLGDVSEISASLVDVSNIENNTNTIAILESANNNENLKKQCLDRVMETSTIIRTLQDVLIKRVVPSGETLVVNTQKLNLAVTKVFPDSLSAEIISTGKVSAMINLNMFKNHEYVGIMMKNTLFNLYTTDESAQSIKSQLTGVQLTTKGGDLEITNAEEPIVLTVVNNNLKKQNAEYRSMNVGLTGEQWAFQSFQIANRSFRAVVDIRNGSIRVDAYLRKKKRPTIDKYDYKFSLPNNSSCIWKNKNRTLQNNAPIDLLNIDMAEIYCKQNPNLIFLSDKEELDGEYVLGLHYVPVPTYESNDKSLRNRRRRRNSDDDSDDGDIEVIDHDEVDENFCVVVLPPPPTPVPTDPPGSWEVLPPTVTNDSLIYSIDILQSKCLFWNETKQTWSSNGCYVGPNTTPDVTECLCNHLTDFGGDVLVAPAPIDFDKVFVGLKNIGNNVGVLMIILTIILVYVLFVVWARKRDRKDKEESGPVIINYTKDSIDTPKIQPSYLLTIVTGSRFGAGTTANVYCELSGSLRDSKVISLKATDDRKLFQARTTTTFQITLPQSIGDLNFVRIFHDNSGKSPSWYLRNMVVTDLATKRRYSFVCGSWLSVESEDGLIEKILPIANDKDLASFHIVFASKASKSLLDGHIWFSVVTRPIFSQFTRVQRVSCCLCLIYMTMLTNAMFFGVGDTGPKILMHLGNVVINITGIIIGVEASFIVVPPSMFVIEVFRRLAPPKKKETFAYNETRSDDTVVVQNCKGLLEGKRMHKKKQAFMFPYYFKYIAYVVIFVSSFVSALFTFFYSMMWGPKKSNQWISSMFAGFFQSVFVIQPIKAAFMAVLFALILRKPVQQEHSGVDFEEMEKNTEEQNNELDKNGNGVVEADEVPILMPSESSIQRARKIKLKEKMTGKIVKEIFTYFIFLLVVSVLAYSEKDSNTYWFRQDLQNMFTNGKYTETQTLNDASNPAKFYLWLRDTLIQNIYVGPWYNDELPKSFKFVENREALLISMPRLRQQRIQADSCIVHTAVKNIVKHCKTFYSMGIEDTQDYKIGWGASNHSDRSKRDVSRVEKVSPYVFQKKRRARRDVGASYQAMSLGRGASLRRRKAQKTTSKGAEIFYVDPAALFPDGTVISCGARWKHYTRTELRGFPVFGKFAIYQGSGYVANLGYNEETGWTVIADLHSHNWMDEQTRSVFVEFTVYNANVNLFATAFLYMEILPTGAGEPSSDFKIFNGYRYALNANIGIRLLESCFIIFVLYFTILELKKIYKQKRAYFKGFFNIIEIILIPLYFAMFGLIIFRWLATSENIKLYQKNPKDFVNFQYPAEADSMLQGVIGVVAFLLNIKFLKYFQFAKTFYKVGLILKSFFYPLLGFMVSFLICFMMFAGAANLGFGSQSKNYHTFIRTCITQFLYLIGATDFEDTRRSGGVIFGPMYYCAYSIFVTIFTFNLLMAIICGAIDEDFEEELEKNLGDINVIEYLMKTFKSITGFYNGDDNDNDKFEEDGQFDGIKQDYDTMDDRMRKIEDIINVLMKKVDKFQSNKDSDELLVEECIKLNERLSRRLSTDDNICMESVLIV